LSYRHWLETLIFLKSHVTKDRASNHTDKGKVPLPSTSTTTAVSVATFAVPERAAVAPKK
jgi:hypothetical protein